MGLFSFVLHCTVLFCSVLCFSVEVYIFWSYSNPIVLTSTVYYFLNIVLVLYYSVKTESLTFVSPSGDLSQLSMLVDDSSSRSGIMPLGSVTSTGSATVNPLGDLLSEKLKSRIVLLEKQVTA